MGRSAGTKAGETGMSWEPGEWRGPFRPLFPLVTVHGRIVWLSKCWRRVLRYMYNDGHDWRREPHFDVQYVNEAELRSWPSDPSQPEGKE